MSFIENRVTSPSFSMKKYLEEYKNSIEDPEKFWKKKASSLNWIKEFSRVKEGSFTDDVYIKWFSDGSLNVLPYVKTKGSMRSNFSFGKWMLHTPN